MAFQEVSYRPAFGRTLAVVTVVVCAVGVVALFWGDATSAIRYVWPIVLVAVLAWALFWRPSLRMQEHGITVENVLAHVLRAVAGDPGESIRVTRSRSTRRADASRSGRRPPRAATERSVSRARTSTASASPRAGEHGSLRPSDALTTPSGNLAQAIRGHWEQLRESGAFASGEDPEAFTITWHYGTIATIAVAHRGDA